METARVNIEYRPLRIGWLIHSQDLASYRKAVRLSHVFWGGRYSPVILVDKPDAAALVELFRPDLLFPLGDNPATATFGEGFPHLVNPLPGDKLFVGEPGRAHSTLLDLQNLLFHFRDVQPWRDYIRDGIHFFTWEDDDPLGDSLLSQFGGYPDARETAGIDYWSMLNQISPPVAIPLSRTGPIPPGILDRANLGGVSRFGIETRSRQDRGWRRSGLYAGQSSNIDDLAAFWNLRAAGITLAFFDIDHPERYRSFRPDFEARVRARLAVLDEFDRKPALWARQEKLSEAREIVGGADFVLCGVTADLWNGLNLQPSAAILGQETALGVLGGTPEAPRISFALAVKPFSGDVWFFQQHLAASIHVFEVGPERGRYCFVPPFAPELNSFVSRKMALKHDELRLEPDRLAIIIDAADTDISLRALPAPSLIEAVFGLAGYTAKISNGGLITQQLVARMGGVDGTRAFKIPGVRRLLRQYGPNESFTAVAAVQLIGAPDPQNPSTSFSQHHRLFIEPRDYDTDLTPKAVFGHLVEKGLFRMGADLRCPTCLLTSWTPLDSLKHRVSCQLCGSNFDATRQLVEGKFAYRRSGILGLERNNQGAVPVALVLQQLSVNLSGAGRAQTYGVSYDLTPASNPLLPTCETDFVVLVPHPREPTTDVIIGEVKDACGTIEENDVANLTAVADALSNRRFRPFIVLAKLGAFTEAEIALASTINRPYEKRVILLTARELEPYHLYERTNKELGTDYLGISAEELARATNEIYFKGAR